MKRLLMSALAVCALGSNAMAAFVVSAPSRIASTGPAGDAGNGVINATFTGTSTQFGTLTFDGDLTEVLTATYASEARWRMTNATLGSFVDYQPTTTTSFTGTIHVNRVSNVLAWADNGDNFSFQPFESPNDGAGPDSNRTNVVFNFDNAPVVTSLGSLPAGSHTFDTITSAFDTELALYEADGTFLTSNDDIGGGVLQSSITQNLGIGDYMLVLGGYNAAFSTGFATPGTASGAYNLNIDGGLAGSGSLASGGLQVFSFSVPEPATIGLLALGGLLIRRRLA